MGSAGALPPGPYMLSLPPLLLQFIHLLHLNQASIQDLISDLTNSHASSLWHNHKGALKVRVDGCAEHGAFLIAVTPRDMDITTMHCWSPELFDLVVSYRKKIDRKTHQPFSYRKISALIKEEHNLSISFNSVKRILEDVVRIKREDRNRKRRKLVA